MKIDLNIPKGKKQKIFLDYLNSHLRKRFLSSNGTAKFESDGSFEHLINGLFLIENQHYPLCWKLIKNKEGTLLFIEVLSNDKNLLESSWEKEINNFILNVYSNAFSENKKKYFFRYCLNYIGRPLDGEYWFSGMRFAPVIPDDDYPNTINTERVVSLDMNVNGIDSADAACLSREIGLRYEARFSLLLDIGFYKTNPDSIWVYSNSSKDIKSIRLNRGFIGYTDNIKILPKKKELCQLGKYKGEINSLGYRIGDLLSFPKETRKILKLIENAESNFADAFDRCARLYQIALLNRNYPTLAMAYQVASIEAICKINKKEKTFNDFLHKYVKSDCNLKEISNNLYGTIRSGHFHSGEFPLGEYDNFNYAGPIFDSDLVHLHDNQYIYSKIIREAIVNWLLDLLSKNKNND